MKPSENDTICALSTPPGPGGIGIVRLSGKDAVGVASKILRLKQGYVGEISHRAGIHYGWVVNPADDSVVDEVLVSVMREPATYTREDVVEINCHGGPAVCALVLKLAADAGARPARPGEFTMRAFLNGRIDLTQAEAVIDVISSSTELALRSAMEQLGGALGRRMGLMREELRELLALVESSIDFPEEEIDYVPAEGLRGRGAAIIGGMDALIGSYDEGRVLREGLRVAIVGRPNVGKSSLLNLICGTERAIVTEVPGTTRDTVEELVSIGGLPVRLVDTAGIRESRDVVEAEGVRRSERALELCDLALFVLDGGVPPETGDYELAGKVRGRSFIAVVNKSDLPSALKAEMLDGLIGDGPAVRISAKSGEGLDDLTRSIRERVMGSGRERQPEACINLRHRDALVRAREAVSRFIEGVDGGLSPELLALELRESLDAVGEAVGDTTPDEVLELIFSRFCIGK